MWSWGRKATFRYVVGSQYQNEKTPKEMESTHKVQMSTVRYIKM